VLDRVRVSAIASLVAMLGWPAALAAGQAPACDGTGSASFAFTGQVQTLLVPAAVTQVTIDAAGAAGGTVNRFAGGNGARLVATFPVTPGETLNVVVGGAGFFGPDPRASRNAGGGGGASFVYRAADTTGLLIAAAGGGGATAFGPGGPGNATEIGSNGGSRGTATGGAAGTGGGGGEAGTTSTRCAGAGGGGLTTDGQDANVGTLGGQALGNGAAGGTSSFSGGSGGFGGGGAGCYLEARVIPFIAVQAGGGGGGGFNGGGGGGLFVSSDGEGEGEEGGGGGGGGGSFSAVPTSFSQSGSRTGDGEVRFCFNPTVAPSIPSASRIGLAIAALLLAGLAVRRLHGA